MTNPLKGELLLKLAGKDYKCRLTIDGIIKIETEIDKGIIAITQKLALADVRVGELAIVLLHALRGGGNDVNMEDVKTIIQNAGIVESCTVVAKLLAKSLSDPSSEGGDSKKA